MILVNNLKWFKGNMVEKYRMCIIISILLSVFLNCRNLNGQEHFDSEYELSLNDVIALATDSSIDAFIAQNQYLVEYWVYKNYKAGKLPYIDLNSTAANFSRSVKQVYNSNTGSFQYVETQTLNNDVNISLNQNISKTGGRIYLDSDLGRLENIQQSGSAQYTTNIIRIGIQQSIFGFNPKKWEDKINPIRYEKAQKDFIEQLENVHLKAVRYFFNLAQAQLNLKIAKNRLANADTLYTIGKKRYDIASISQEDLYTLELDLINSQNKLKTSTNNAYRAKLQLASFLRFNSDLNFSLNIPDVRDSLEVEAVAVLNFAEKNNAIFLGAQQTLLEAERNTEKAKKNSKFSSNLNASFGLKQTAESLSGAYRDPTDQESVRLTLSVPILDWGVAKGQYQLAQRQQEAVRLRQEQALIDFKHDVLNTVNEFHVQRDLVFGAAKADTVAQKAYEVTKKRFLIGKSDITKLGVARQSQINAKVSYLSALEKYWKYYYTIRKITHFDFEKNIPLIETIQNLNFIDE